MNKHVGIIIVGLLILAIPVYLWAGSLDNNLQVIASDENGVVLELDVPWPDITEVQEGGRLYQKITIPGFGTTSDVGKPGLPLKGVLVGVPDTSMPDIEILGADYSILDEYNVYPVPRPVVVENGADRRIDLEFAKDAGVYNTNAFFPSKIAEIGFTGFMRDQKVMQIKVFPVQFNPVTGQFRLYSTIRLRVNFGAMPQVLGKGVVSTVKRKGKRHSTHGINGAYERLLKGVILNYSEIRREGR